MRQVADVFPIKHLFQSLLTAFEPNVGGPGVAASDIAVVAVWGVAGLFVAMRTFQLDAPRRLSLRVVLTPGTVRGRVTPSA